MRPNHDKHSNPALIESLESVNAAVQVVHCAWRHFAAWQETGGRCVMTARQLAVARSLLTEAIEDWAMAVGRLLAVSRRDSALAHLSENLERSLRRAAVYLGALAVVDQPVAVPNVPSLPQ